MWSAIAASVDLIHALLMAAWVLGLPLLFWRRWPRASRVFAAYAATFVVANLASRWLLGECFLTAIARACWNMAGAGSGDSAEWFTVRAAQAVFRMTPSHRAIKAVSEVLILATAVGVFASPGREWHRSRNGRGHQPCV
jgi:hypothetical protein